MLKVRAMSKAANPDREFYSRDLLGYQETLGITHDVVYDVIEEKKSLYLLKDDSGKRNWYLKCRFEIVERK